MPSSNRPAWSSTTCPRSTSRPTGATGSASPGSPKERRLEPQITIGLLADRARSLESAHGELARTRVFLRLRMAPVRHKLLARTAGELLDALTVAGLAERLRGDDAATLTCTHEPLSSDVRGGRRRKLPGL